ncbi:hypothetical protein I317_01167 [Kwoniella heveanensis CBS 569]|nr:hypothetical protein I317_01167 [Kwoniella heveanensis CBS 569]
MDPSNILTPATGSISSRFESQTSIDEAKETRQKEWREAYARLGQEPPPEQPDEEYDPRTLYERLQVKKDAKKEEWDNKMKLSNQWRGLDSEEQRFLAEKEAEKKAEQRKLEEKEAEELREYREQLAARHANSVEAPGPSASSSSSTTKKVPPKPARKDVKSLMKGVVVKKKPKSAAGSPAVASQSVEVPKTNPPIKSLAAPKDAADDTKSGDEDLRTHSAGGSAVAGTKRNQPDSEPQSIPSVPGETIAKNAAVDEKRRKVAET